MEISWTDSATNEEVLRRDKEERNVLHSLRRSKANWIACIVLVTLS